MYANFLSDIRRDKYLADKYYKKALERMELESGSLTTHLTAAKEKAASVPPSQLPTQVQGQVQGQVQVQGQGQVQPQIQPMPPLQPITRAYSNNSIASKSSFVFGSNGEPINHSATIFINTNGNNNNNELNHANSNAKIRGDNTTALRFNGRDQSPRDNKSTKEKNSH
ncbi:BEACH domain-containing protein, partial [Reticulomyxa filosa]